LLKSQSRNRPRPARSTIKNGQRNPRGGHKEKDRARETTTAKAIKRKATLAH